MRIPDPWLIPVLPVPAAGELIGLSRAAAYRAAAAGELPTITVGGTLWVPTADLYRLVGLPVPERRPPPVT